MVGLVAGVYLLRFAFPEAEGRKAAVILLILVTAGAFLIGALVPAYPD